VFAKSIGQIIAAQEAESLKACHLYLAVAEQHEELIFRMIDSRVS
jgi:hypothetical protein